MRTTNAVNFYCRPCKINKKGYSPIEVSLIISGKRCFFNLPRKEIPKIFAKETKKKSSELSLYLEEVRRKLNEAQLDLLRQDKPITPSNLKEYIRSGGEKVFTVEDMFNDYISMLQPRVGKTIKECSYRKYLIVYKEFTEYFSKDRQANTFNQVHIRQYYAHLESMFKKSTVSSKMVKLRTVFKLAYTSGKIPTYPFNGVKISRGTPPIEFLTEDEMNRIINYPYPIERLERTADLFVFQANSGLSYVDMANLSREDLKEHEGLNYIKKRRIKTGIEFTAIVFPVGVRIFRKYDGNLPVITNQRYNGYLKEIGDIVGIEKSLHSHLGRKTYATMLLSSGISISNVAKMLGHSSTITTQQSYAKTLDDSIFEELLKINSK